MNCFARAPGVLITDVSFQIPQRDGGCNHRREVKPIGTAFRITRKATIQPNHQPKSQRWINPIRKATQLVEQQRLTLKNCLLLIHIGGRRHKVGGQDGVAAEGRCVSSSSLGWSGKLWVSSSSQQSTQFEKNGQFNTN